MFWRGRAGLYGLSRILGLGALEFNKWLSLREVWVILPRGGFQNEVRCPGNCCHEPKFLCCWELKTTEMHALNLHEILQRG